MSPVTQPDDPSGSSTSTHLNVNAVEFTPFSIPNVDDHQINVANKNNNDRCSSRNSGSKTGAVPKKFYDRRSNYRQEKFYEDNRNSWRNNANNEGSRNNYPRNNNENAGSSNSYPRNNDENVGIRNNYPRNKDENAGSRNNYPRNNDENAGSRNNYPRKNDRENEEEAGTSSNDNISRDRKFYRNNTSQNGYYQNRRSNNNNNGSSNTKINTFGSSRFKSSSSSSQSGSKFEQQYYERQAEGESYDEKPNNVEGLHTNSSNNNNRRQKKFAERKKEVKKATSATDFSQRERLIKEIENNTLECMICCDKIKSYQAIWSCSNCYHILHLNCIKTWAKNSKSEEGSWRCVACNAVTATKLTDYLCFCGKLKNPVVNRGELAHSCGQMCLSTQNCIHPCQLLCHAGPHEICHASVLKFCGCGKTSKTYQCSMKALFECESTCGKQLNCGIHKCLKTCHQGECDSCSQEIECVCYCENEKKNLPCTVENFDKVKFSCEQECKKMLACQNHECQEKCHSGNCKSCKLLPEYVKSCPCGKMPIKMGERKTCIDPIPICEGKCGKALRCGKLSQPHVCAKKCHLLECPPCNQTSNVKCRCGRKEEKIPCKDLINSDLRCKKKCNKFKSCGRHKCNVECCIELNHACNANCNRFLDCKKHKCQRPCHIGNCAPCPRVSFDELQCECGKTIIYPPVPCGTRIIECKNTCTRKHKCDHPVKHNCHSEPECPSCVFLTKKFCYGKHEERMTIPCNQDSFCCGMPCGKLLKCGRHNCIKTCHQGECEKINETCSQKCTVKRNDCEHNCNAPCHEGACLDNVACREKVQVTCSCGNLKSTKTCEQVLYEIRKLQRVHIQMQMQDNQTDGDTDFKSMLNNFKKTTKILDCNDDCKTLERNRRLDIAFKVQNPTLASTPRFTPNYSEHVRSYYKKDSSFVNMVHEKLTELVKLAKDSKAPFRCHSFPSMNRDKRHVIHDMSELFGVEAQAYDAEPNRNIVATAQREYCWLPSMSVQEIAMREQGGRRPPSNLTIKK